MKSKIPDFLSEVVLTVVDVGAREGLPPQWEPFSNQVRAVLVEPDPAEAALLRRNAQQFGLKEVHIIPIALGDKNGSVGFHLANSAALSSVLQPNTPFLSRFEDVERYGTRKLLELSCDTLDSQLAQLGISDVDVIKIDVEGYEGRILAGGSKTLQGCLGLVSEVAFADRYIGGTHFSEVNRYAQEAGMTLADLERVWWHRKHVPPDAMGIGQIVFANCIWLRDPVEAQGLDRNTLLKTVLLMLVYSFYDWAYEAISVGIEHGIADETEKTALHHWISKRTLDGNPLHRFVANLPHFPFKRSIARMLGLISRDLCGNRDGETDANAWNRKWRWLQ